MPRTKNYKGRCFEAAHRALINLHEKDEDPVIVYGFIGGFVDKQDKYFPLWIVHAWVECNDMVYDYTFQEEPASKDIYYSEKNVHKLMWHYDFHEYLNKAVKIGRFAPIDPVLCKMINLTISDPESQYEWMKKHLPTG